MAPWKAGLLGVLVTFIGAALLVGLLIGLVALLTWGGPWPYFSVAAAAIAAIGWANGVRMWGRK